jgi:phosphoserine phosphatase
MNVPHISSSLSTKALEFIGSVLQLQPELAVFDCDGTLWGGDAGEGFFDWELKRGLVSGETVTWARGRYASYLAGKVSEDDMCAEMATLHDGLSEDKVLRAAHDYFNERMASQIFPELQVLVHKLQETGCDVWAVSSTNEWVIREAMKHFGIPQEKILAASVRVMEGKITNQLIRVPSGEGKPRAILEVIGRAPNVALGNSVWDAAMLKIADHPFAVNPTSQLQEIAEQNKWPIYHPEPLTRA